MLGLGAGVGGVRTQVGGMADVGADLAGRLGSVKSDEAAAEEFRRLLQQESVRKSARSATAGKGLSGTVEAEGVQGDGEKSDPKKAARSAAEEFVAVTFVQPLFKQLRSTNHASAPFAPGNAEKQFQAMADAEIAKRMVKSANWPLVDMIASGLEKRAKGIGAVQKSEARPGLRAGVMA